ncbi:MAG: hypothetical protein NDI75_00975 [Candidatus Didemnitutus sp.]|nr:hypothetical protein [Candidatus Didemnitutus sp.]
MKPESLLKAAALAALTVLTAHAGPPPEFLFRSPPKIFAKTAQVAAATTPAAKSKMACGACKTVKLREPRYRAPISKGAPDMIEVGTRHECRQCDGVIVNLKGKVTDRMKVTCPTCVETGCCVPPAAASQ